MIFEETIPAIISLTLITVVVVILFSLKFRNLRKNFLEAFFKLPSVIVVGPKNSGKITMIKNMTENEVVTNPFEKDVRVGYLTESDNKIQMITLHYDSLVSFVNSGELKKLNNKIFLNVFDVSPDSDDIETQITEFEKSLPYFKGSSKIIVANKVDIADDKKLNKLKKKFDKVHKISSITREGLNDLKNDIKTLAK